MAAKKLLHLMWMDSTGECYHEANLPTMVVREQLKRAKVFRLKFSNQYGTVTMSSSGISYAEVSRCVRAVVGETEDGGKVYVTLAEDAAQGA
jgi:hypothetical protein